MLNIFLSFWFMLPNIASFNIDNSIVHEEDDFPTGIVINQTETSLQFYVFEKIPANKGEFKIIDAKNKIHINEELEVLSSVCFKTILNEDLPKGRFTARLITKEKVFEREFYH